MRYNNWVKKYLLYGALGVGFYLCGKYVASRLPNDEQKATFTIQKEEIQKLKSTVKQQKSQYRIIQNDQSNLLGEQDDLETKLSKYE